MLEAPDPERHFLQREGTGILANLIRELPDRCRLTLTLRYGLDGSEPRTLQTVAGLLGVTPERVRQIEGKALRHLRHSSRAKLLEPYLEDCLA